MVIKKEGTVAWYFSATMAREQRKHPRRNLGLNARITWPRQMPCIIADISASGARLTLDNVRLLPNEFVLSLSVHLIKKCKVMWRRKTEVGVRFIDAHTARAAHREIFWV